MVTMEHYFEADILDLEWISTKKGTRCKGQLQEKNVGKRPAPASTGEARISTRW